MNEHESSRRTELMWKSPNVNKRKYGEKGSEENSKKRENRYYRPLIISTIKKNRKRDYVLFILLIEITYRAKHQRGKFYGLLGANPVAYKHAYQYCYIETDQNNMGLVNRCSGILVKKQNVERKNKIYIEKNTFST